MRATIDWSVSLLPNEQRATARRPRRLRDPFHAWRRSRRSAADARGRDSDRGARRTRGRVARQAVEIGGRSIVLPAGDRPRVRDRAPGGTRRGRTDGVAHADYYSASCSESRPGLRGAGQVDGGRTARTGAVRTCARPCATWSTRTGWKTPATSRGPVRLLVDLGFLLRGAAVDAGIAREAEADLARTPARWRAFFSLWAEMWQRPTTRSSPASASACACSPRAATSRPPPWRSPARGTARLQFPDLDAATARDGADGSDREVPTPRRRLGRVARRGGPRLGRHGSRGQSLTRSSTSTARRRSPTQRQDVFTRAVAGNNRARVMFLLGELEAAERSGSSLSDCRYGCTSTRAHVRARGDLRHRCVAGRRRGVPAPSRRSRRRSARRPACSTSRGSPCTLEPLAALRDTDPEGVAAGERAGAEMSLAEAVAVALPGRRGRCCGDGARHGDAVVTCP